MTRRFASRATFALWLLACASACARASPPPPAGTVSQAPAVELMNLDFGGDFTLTNQDGVRRGLSDLRGRVVLLFFGYTSCPDVCPLTMSRIATALRDVPEAASAVETLFVTVDVDRDTPKVLRDYVKSFRVTLEGLTGTRAEIDAVVARYRAAYQITPSSSAAGHDVSHSTYTYLIDRHGRLRYIFRDDEPPETIAEGVKAALAAS